MKPSGRCAQYPNYSHTWQQKDVLHAAILLLAPKCRPVTWNDLEVFTSQNWWSSGLEGLRCDYPEHYSAVIPLLPELLHCCNFSIVFQWRGHDPIYDLTSPNKKILDMRIAVVHGLAPHAKFRNHRSKTVGPSRGRSRICIISIGLIWWPDLGLKIWLEV